MKSVAEALTRIAHAISAAIPGAKVIRAFEGQPDALRLFVSQGEDRIKIELSPVLRGSVFPEELREVAPAVEELFGYIEMQLLSIPDLYAGKICAASTDSIHPTCSM
ncbi:nucleotidyl transferase AbiEii/AbiGii toxin family protein [Mesorhizobium australafricanum]|uniref:Nucleotidyl transferase AbiEii/AbiGii toxin family protein n=1 Tax=Mesorhizobium australafricanum TaxID=3072311 RepID=A0ABU4X6D0_9HYPH|nr:nucleotidyl transferase AbiEii/AbiGii toxin family protein [Mesorhizobium sp. VK3E]MDX8443876.1 nucleotidyl transferase AbiEii/AbiGii toxin family protein [Mesorhizobium sp. VK3E]